MAVGGLLKYFETGWSIKSTDFLESYSATIASAEMLEAMELDLQAARACFHLGLTTKLDHWSRLPWVLAGLGHFDDSVARNCAARVAEFFGFRPTARGSP